MLPPGYQKFAICFQSKERISYSTSISPNGVEAKATTCCKSCSDEKYAQEGSTTAFRKFMHSCILTFTANAPSTQLFRKRLKIVRKYSQLRRHIRMLLELGADGMSSDGSDDEGNGGWDPSDARVMLVHRPTWRAQIVSEWLQAIDAIAVLYGRRENQRKRSKGALPCRRLRNEAILSLRDPVKSLPHNAYDPTWLSSVQNLAINIQPTEELYQFVHDNQLYRYVLMSGP